jgi:hypothetical protein
MLANAAYLEEKFMSAGHMGAQSGQDYYRYPDPKFAEPGFLDVPGIEESDSIASLTFPRSE